MLLVHFDLDGPLPKLGQLDVKLLVVPHHHGGANLHGVREEMLAVLILRSLGRSPEGPVVEGVGAGRRFGHLALEFLLPQCLQAVDLSLVFHPLAPVIIIGDETFMY